MTSKNKSHTSATDSNPILKPSNYPHRAIPFHEIKEEHFLPALEEAIKVAQSQLEAIRHQSAAPDFDNTIEAMELVGEKVDLVSSVFFNRLNAETSDELQDLANQVGPLLANYSSDILLDKNLFSRVQAVHDQEKKIHGEGKLSSLNKEQQALLENTYSDFVRNGALLNEIQKSQLRAIDEELSKLGPQFNQNVLKATIAYELHIQKEEELSGLPDSEIEAAAQTAKERNKPGWVITLDAPSIVPFLKYSDHRGHREALWKAYNSRCNGGEFDNRDVIKKIVNLRYQRAELLGYKTHADFVLRRRMAETPEKVHQFLDRLLEASLPAAAKEVRDITDHALSLNGPSQLMPWDFSYYSEKYKKSLFDFDEEKLRPYFQLENVIEGVFEHARRLYGLQFKKTDQFPVYHPDVMVFEVFKDKSEEFIGLFYADFFPRPTKKGGAWMTNYYEQGFYHHGLVRPHVAIVCNFTKPTADKPSLLSFDEVETLFHEFGHSLHSLLSKCHYRSLSGTNVYWDFVELPSQIMENWVSEQEALDLFAKHYQTGEKIPEYLAKKIKETSRFLAGYSSVRQINFALLDLAWHDADPRQIHDVAKYEDEMTQRSRVLPLVPGALASASFSHIFGGGYAAGYYSYKWAEVLDADAFEFFKERGLFNTEVSELFESHVLSKGGTEHPMKLYQQFRGREPDPDALLRRLGLIEFE